MARSIHKIIEIPFEEMHVFMYARFILYRDDFPVHGCHTGGISSNVTNWRFR